MVLGITDRKEAWTARGGRLFSGRAVKNQDLWHALSEEINHFTQEGTEVIFWRIPGELNAEAGAAAKEAAQSLSPVREFTKHNDVEVLIHNTDLTQ